MRRGKDAAATLLDCLDVRIRVIVTARSTTVAASGRWMRSFIFLFGFPVTRDVAMNKKNREGFKQLVDICAQQTIPRARQGRGRSQRHLVCRALRYLAEATASV